jgi:hypothetical protein
MDNKEGYWSIKRDNARETPVFPVPRDYCDYIRDKIGGGVADLSS